METREKTRSSVPLPALLTVRETAAYLGLSLESVYKMIRGSLIPAVKVGGSWRVDSEQLLVAVRADKLSLH